MKFAIFAKIDKDVSDVEKLVTKACLKKGLVLDNDNPDFVFVLGGDGTFLRAVHAYLDQIDYVKFIGVRCGTLGFFYEFEPSDINKVVDLLVNDKYEDDSHRLIECRLGNKKIYALNEIRFENPFHTLVCTVKIGDELLETFHGNGLLVCSELGSTAYNKSLNGAVISHDLDLLQLTEISTIQNNIYRSLGSSLILKPETEITFTGDFSNVIIGYDHLTRDSGGATNIVVTGAQKRIHAVYAKGYSYLTNLKRSFIE